jgi:hypothetical protein
LDRPDIKEIDVNPLIADAAGGITAVDTLVCRGEGGKSKETPLPVDYHRINRFFYPNSIALSAPLQK